MSVIPLPANQNQEIEAWLEEHGVTGYEFRARVQLIEIDRTASLKNQARTSAIDDEHLIVIAEAMERGKQLPPIVVYKRPRIKLLKTIDGNHRIGAAELCGRSYLSGYIITQELTETQERLLIATANTGHGLPNTMAERTQIAIWLVQHRGTTQKDAASVVGIPAKTLGDRMAIMAAEKRLVDLVGANKLNRIGTSTRKRLNALKSDVIAKEAAILVVETKMTQPEANELVTALNRARSESEQLAVIDGVREERAQQKEATAGHKVQIAPPFRRLSQLANGILKFDVETVRDPIVDPKVRQQVKLRIAEAQERLAEIISAL